MPKKNIDPSEIINYMYDNISYPNLKRLLELLDLFPYRRYKECSYTERTYKEGTIKIDRNHISLLLSIANTLFLSSIDVIDLWIHDMLFINLPTDIINIPDRKLISINVAGSNLLEKQYSIVNNKGTIFILTYSDKDPHLCVLKIEGSEVSFKDCHDFLKFTVDVTDEIRISGMHSPKLYNIFLRQFGNTKEEDDFLKEMNDKNGFLREMKERHAEMMDYIQRCREEETQYAKLRNTKKIIKFATGVSNRRYKELYNAISKRLYASFSDFIIMDNLNKIKNISGVDFDLSLFVKIISEMGFSEELLNLLLVGLEKFKKEKIE